MTSSQKLPAFFLFGIAAAVLALLGMCLVTAANESFIRDDFAFLAYVQRPHWSWAEVYFPIEERWWWAYRPLGMQTYFYLAFQLFGLNAFGYFTITILLHFATGWLAYRLMLRLGIDARIAAAGGVLAISRYPAMHDIFYGSVFHYVAAIFFSLLAITSFLDHARSHGGGAARGLVSAMWLLLALLCNEFPVVLPFFLVLLSLYADRFPAADGPAATEPLSAAALIRGFRRAAPHFVLVGLYLVWRFRVIAPVEANQAYIQNFDLVTITENVGRQLFFLFGDAATLVAALLVLAASLTLTLRSQEGRALFRARLVPLYGLSLTWMLGLMAPFAILLVTHSRFSKPIEVPAVIAFAATLDVLWRVHRERHAHLLEWALLALVFTALPYATLWERYHAPLGIHGRELVSAVEAHGPDIEPRSRVVLLYNAPGLASFHGGQKFKRETFGGGAVLQSYFNDKMLMMDFHDLWQAPVDRSCQRCIYLQLMPTLEVRAAEPRLVRFVPPYPMPDQPKRKKALYGPVGRRSLLEELPGEDAAAPR